MSTRSFCCKAVNVRPEIPQVKGLRARSKEHGRCSLFIIKSGRETLSGDSILSIRECHWVRKGEGAQSEE